MEPRRTRIRLANAILIAGLIGPPSAGHDTGAVVERLRERLDADALASCRQVVAFYADRVWTPVWTDGQPSHPLIHTVLQALDRARGDGLDSGPYHADDLTALAHFPDRRLSPEDLARRDLLLTDAVFTLARQLAGTYLDPATLYDLWETPPRDGGGLACVADALASGRGLIATLDALRPRDTGYAGLRAALARYEACAAAGGWPALPSGPALRHGDAGPRVAALRARLAAEGYAVPAAGAPDRFDDALAVAVSAFQTRHGLRGDGVAGPATRAALDVPPDARAAQIAANLARLRWLPRDPGERHIRVNIPDFRLDVVEDGEVALSLRAVVGRTDRPTPVLSSAVTCLEVNPSWNIPPKIARADVLPHVKRDPGYLAARNIRVYESWLPGARELQPQAVDWQAMRAWELAYKLRQEPGPGNALGRIKLLFANPFSVYIHDTPGRGVFADRRRSRSSGCVRVEDPLTLAAYLLGEGAARGDALLSALDSRETVRLRLSRPVPVQLVYLTAWADRDGAAQFRDDLYGYDAVLSAALAGRSRTSGS